MQPLNTDMSFNDAKQKVNYTQEVDSYFYSMSTIFNKTMELLIFFPLASFYLQYTLRH